MKILQELIDATWDAILWPFILVGLLCVGLRRETWQYLYRAEILFKSNQNYVDLVSILHIEENWAACQWVEDTYVKQIQAAQYVEADRALYTHIRKAATLRSAAQRRAEFERDGLHAERLKLEAQLLQVRERLTA